MNLGNYRIVRQIGEGGFGRTYEVQHNHLGTKACLKQNINVSDADTKILKQEAELMWDVHHHSLPTMKDFFPVGDGSHALVMSYIEGKTIEHVVTKKGPIHPEDVSWVAQRTLNALYYLHARGIVHADVKPANLIVQPRDHNAFLVDYGLSVAKPTRATKPTGHTEVFGAPEIIARRPPIPESDFYGLGMTMLYAMGGNILDKSWPSHVPDPLRNFCDDLIRHNPDDRPNWESQDLVARLSQVRQDSFGRRAKK